MLVELGRAERLLPEAHDFTALREAVALARDPEQRAEIALELAPHFKRAARATYARCATDRLGDAAAAMDAGIAEAQRRGLTPMFMQLAVMRAETALRSGDLDTAEVYGEQALELGRELGVEHVALLPWLPIVLIERGHVDAACELVESVELDNSGWWRSGAITRPSRLRAASSPRRSRSARRGAMGSRSR